MGYKLAGFDVVGCVEIDPRMFELYQRNLHPRNSYLMDIRDFNAMDGIPAELSDLDVLDGSPPCTTFSTSGPREKSWGKARRYAEGAAFQTLDDLPMVFMQTVEKLHPKCYIMENVTGMNKGAAKGYIAELLSRSREIGYEPQVFKLNSALMGVPQMRERVFIIGNRMGWEPLMIDFKEKVITFGEVRTERGDPITSDSVRNLVEEYWRPGENDLVAAYARKIGNPRKRAYFNCTVQPDGIPAFTQVASDRSRSIRECDRLWLNAEDTRRVQTFPADYDFGDENAVHYVCGMSVPPVMMANIAYEVRRQWLEV